MSQIKLAAILLMPLAYLSTIAAAQDKVPDCAPKSATARTQTPTPLFIVPPGDVYGSYVPYSGPLLNASSPQGDAAAEVPPAACETPKVETASNNSSKLPPKPQPQQKVSASEVAPAQKTAPVQSASADTLPTTCPTPVYVVPPNDVYGRFVPYVAPPQPAGCVTTPLAMSSTPLQPNSSAVEKPQPDSVASLQLMTQPTGNPLALAAGTPAPASPAPPAEGSSITGEYIRSVPMHRAATIPQEVRPFRSVAIGFKASTLGVGIELATPVSSRINLRSNYNFFAFDDPFNIDGVNYDARLHLQSSQTTVDWFVGRFHVSPGFLYFKNSESAPASVGPGQTFVLGTQTFLNSVDDPTAGTSSVVYPHKFVPLLLFGFGNIIPRNGSRLSFPIEFGAAYTGAPVISVALNGTACTTEGCVNFAGNTQAQTYLQQEVHNLNEDLKKWPVFPIVSIGVAYHF